MENLLYRYRLLDLSHLSATDPDVMGGRFNEHRKDGKELRSEVLTPFRTGSDGRGAGPEIRSIFVL